MEYGIWNSDITIFLTFPQHTHTYTHTCTHTCTHTYTHMHTHTCTHTCTHTHAHIHTCTHTCTHTHTLHARTHTHNTHTYTLTHMQVKVSPVALWKMCHHPDLWNCWSTPALLIRAFIAWTAMGSLGPAYAILLWEPRYLQQYSNQTWRSSWLLVENCYLKILADS